MFPALNKARNFLSKSSDQQFSKRDMRKHQEGASGGRGGSGVGRKTQPHSVGGPGTVGSSDSSQEHPATLHKDNEAGPGWVTAGCRDMHDQAQEHSVTCRIPQARDFIQNMMQLPGEAGTVSHGACHGSCFTAVLPATWEHNCAMSELSRAQMC